MGIYVAPDGARRPRLPPAADHRPVARAPTSRCRTRTAACSVVFNGEIYNFQRSASGLAGGAATASARTPTPRSSSICTKTRATRSSTSSTGCSRSPSGTRRRQPAGARARPRRQEAAVLLSRRAAGSRSRRRSRRSSRIPTCRSTSNEAVMPSYFIYGYVPGPGDVLSRRHAGRAGHASSTIDGDGASAQRRLLAAAISRGAAAATARSTRRGAGERVRALVTEAVERRLVSDVPLGAFLSGGVDSTDRRRRDGRLMREPVKTFSIGFEGDAGVRRNRVRARGRRAVQDRPHRVPRHAVGRRPDRHADLASRRPVRRFVGDSDLSRVAADAPARDGRADGRRRRRGCSPAICRFHAALAAERAAAVVAGALLRPLLRAAAGVAQRAALAVARAPVRALHAPAAARAPDAVEQPSSTRISIALLAPAFAATAAADRSVSRRFAAMPTSWRRCRRSAACCWRTSAPICRAICSSRPIA